MEAEKRKKIFLLIANGSLNDSEPSAMASKVLENAKKDLGVEEDSPNNGPRIREYFRRVNFPLKGNSGLEWCAAAVSTWLKDAGVPIYGHVGALKLADQFISKSKFVHAKEVKQKHLMPGNVVFYFRGIKGSGQGHVGILVNGTMESLTTIDGNSGENTDRVAEMTRSFDSLYGIGLVSEM